MENAKIKNMYDLSQSIAGEYLSQFTYPWEALKGISDFIKKLGPTLDPEIYEKRGENIWVAKSATVAPTACLNGPLIIDEDAEIRHCAFIRGSAIIGKGSVVGNSTEIKNDIIFNTVQVPHYNYVGDSILGYKSHMGLVAENGIPDVIVMWYLYRVKNDIIFDLRGISDNRSFSNDCASADKCTVTDLGIFINNQRSVQTCRRRNGCTLCHPDIFSTFLINFRIKCRTELFNKIADSF